MSANRATDDISRGQIHHSCKYFERLVSSFGLRDMKELFNLANYLAGLSVMNKLLNECKYEQRSIIRGTFVGTIFNFENNTALTFSTFAIYSLQKGGNLQR